MNKKIIISLIIVALLVLIIACEEEEALKGIEMPFIGGSQGLVIEFEPMGPEEGGEYVIYENEQFPITFNLRNKGEEDIGIGDAKIEIKGILLSDFSGIISNVLTNKNKIEGVSEFNEQGGEDIIDFTPVGGATYIQEVAGAHYSPTIFAEYAYAYKTKVLVPEVCFKENLRDERICTVKESKKVYSSGAPIQVKSVEEDTAGAGKISLKFEVENIGTGDVTLPNEEFNPRYGQIAYQLEPATERAKWQCTAAGRENQARLTNRRAVINCRLKDPLPKDALYTKEIGLTLSYDYRNTASKTLKIKKAG